MTGKRYLDRVYPYLINNCEDGYYLTDGNGFMLNSDELLDIGANLIKFAKIHNNNEIEEYNQEKYQEIEDRMNDWLNTPKRKSKSSIYIMECGGKYKIGVSKNLETRKKQLDNRPYPVNIIYKSGLIEEPYNKEQELHSAFKEKRIGGEWFELTEQDIISIKNYLEECL